MEIVIIGRVQALLELYTPLHLNVNLLIFAKLHPEILGSKLRVIAQ